MLVLTELYPMNFITGEPYFDAHSLRAAASNQRAEWVHLDTHKWEPFSTAASMTQIKDREIMATLCVCVCVCVRPIENMHLGLIC